MKEPSWDELLCSTGKTVEDIGRGLRGKGRIKPKVYTTQDLERLRDALQNCAGVLNERIKSMKNGNC